MLIFIAKKHTVEDGGLPNEIFGSEGLLYNDKSFTLPLRSLLLDNCPYGGSTS